MSIIRNIFSKKITINNESNLIIVNIKESCSLQEYISILKRTKYSNLLNIIDLKHLLTTNTILPKRILVYKKDNIIYIISITNNNIYISKKTTDTNIIEHTINIDKLNYSYQISQSIHTLDGNTIDVKTHNKNPKKNYSFMNLPKNEALTIARTLTEEISTIPNISNYINIPDITKILNVYLNKDYYPVISNEILTLSWKNRYGSTNINEKTRATLEIILNETNEVIGTISFNTSYNPSNSYTGSVSYNIKDEFQNNHYATITLSLLKKLLKEHQHQQNKPIYISTEEHNIKSQHGAINNGGELCYEGTIPGYDNLTKFSGITKIKMYKIPL